MTSSAQTPEPTDEQLRAAMDVLGWIDSLTYDDLNAFQQEDVTRVACALAAAVTAEREKYLSVAEELEAIGRAAPQNMWDRGYNSGHSNAARRIREVSR